jgi:hypothetical protein
MTEIFDNTIRRLIKEMLFKDIPDEPPYGFWIGPDLELYPVTFQGHTKKAGELVLKPRSKLNDAYRQASQESEMSILTPMEFLLKSGFSRVVIESKRLVPYPVLFYTKPSSRKQKELIQDLAMIYDVDPMDADSPEAKNRLARYLG